MGKKNRNKQDEKKQPPSELHSKPTQTMKKVVDNDDQGNKQKGTKKNDPITTTTTTSGAVGIPSLTVNAFVAKSVRNSSSNNNNDVEYPPPSGESDTSSSDEDDSDDDELVLDGVVVRNPDVSSSSSDDDDSSDEEDDTSTNGSDKKSGNNAKGTTKRDNNSNKKRSSDEIIKKRNDESKSKKNKKKRNGGDDDVLNVEFIFNDMDEKYFHGLKSLLCNSSTVYQGISSELADTMIDNISVGTVVSTSEQYSDDGTVFGFASILNVTTYQSTTGIQYLKNKICLHYCPKEYKTELNTILSGTTNRPAGFLLHGRMLNLPIEMVHTLHEQLIYDIDWAIQHAEGGIVEQKSLDFGILIRIAPCVQEGKKGGHTAGTTYYKYFDDEILAQRAEYTFNCPAPTSTSKSETGEKESLCVMVLTKQGHRDAIDDIKRMVGM